MRLISSVIVAAMAIGACAGESASDPTTVSTPATEASAEPTATTTTSTTAAQTSTTMTVASVDVIDEGFLAEQVVKSWDAALPGAVMIAVYDRDGRRVHSSVGSDSTDAIPKPDDVFRVGSITKMFTSIAVLSLVDEGLVDLDASAAGFLTRIEADESVSVRDLLQHSSGLPEYTGGGAYLETLLGDPARAWSPEEVISLASSDTLDFEPGTAFSYSNTNYMVLGLLIEEVTGQAYHDVVRDRIIDPLGMSLTYLEGFEDGLAAFGGYHSLYGTVEPVDFDFTSIATNAWAEGGMVSSGGDLHKMLLALFAGEVISPELVTEMTLNAEWGFGTFAPEWSSDTPLIGHDGRTVGSGTFLIHAPETGMTVFTVANADHLRVSPATGNVAELIGVPNVRLVSSS